MSDVVLESIRVVILLYAVVYLAKAGMNRSELCRRGWSFMLVGMGLLLFGSMMDLTDNYESLNRFVIIGDTPAQAFLEKMVGFLGGFLLLIIGLVQWIPTVTSVERIEQLNKELKAEITERKKAEAQLILAKDVAEEINEQLLESTSRANDMAAQAKWANAAKSQLLANMSHDIRTPMNGIIGFSDMLTDEQLTLKQKELVESIRNSAANLLNLINDILDCSKIEAGQLNIEMIDCPLGQILNSQESIAKTLTKEKSIDFKMIVGSGLPAQIRSDPYRLNQCLTNLLSNAVKFTDQGHIHLSVSLSEENDKHSVRFDIEDTGIGIPEDRQEAVFESFSQADGSTTRKYGGTGLGLTITKQLASLLGGELRLTSKPGKGSVFSLVIPTGVNITDQPLLDLTSTAVVTEVPQEVAPVLFSGKVLVADDVEGNQKLMRLMLSKLGVDVVIVEDGNKAMQRVLSQSFDLILMDMQMPRMDGYEATFALRQRACRTPIVALTANAMKGDDQKCLEAGCDGYLTKPIDRGALSQLLAKYLPVRQEAMGERTEVAV